MMRKRKSHNFISLASSLGCSLIVCSTIAIHAQTVALKLRNGDRLSGNIISENTNQVVFSNAWTKQITIPLADIQSRETVAPPPAITNAPAPANVVPPTVAKVIPPAAIAPPKPVEKKAPPSWHGDLQVGADVGLGETRRELYHGRFKITYAPVSDGLPPGTSKLIDRFRNTFEYNAAYGTITSERTIGGTNTITERNLSANLMNGSSKTDFDIAVGKRAFVYNLAGAGYDEIRKIDFRYEIGPGIGYHLFTRSNFVMNTEAGLNYQAQYFEDGSETERVYYRFAEDLTWKIAPKLTLDEKLEIFPEVSFDEFRLRFESNLRYWLWENISFNLSVLDTYDTQAAPNVDKNDLQIRSSIGVKF